MASVFLSVSVPAGSRPHVFLCRKDCLPAHIVMVAPARRGRSAYPSIFPCVGRISFPYILPWSHLPGEGHRSGPPFREYVFLSSYKTVFAIPTKPVVPARQKGSPVSVHVFLCRKDCLPHILSWSRLPGKGCIHYTIFLIAAAPSKAETSGYRFSPRAAAKTLRIVRHDTNYCIFCLKIVRSFYCSF